jgi:beta-D-xylosidase 4
VEYTLGCQISGNDSSGFASAIELACLADIVFFFSGLNQSIETEGRDRISIDLPPIQFALLQELEKVIRSPLHVVIMSGSGLDLSYIRDSSNFASLVWMGYAGQAGGLVVGTVIFGQYNPAGRLPVTFYPASYVDDVSMFDMQMRSSEKNPGRTYKFYTGQAVYEFGTGLSYTTFAYSRLNDSSISSYSIRTLLKDTDDERRVLGHLLRVNVTNTGSMAGDDVVLAFVTPPATSLKDPTPPIKQLIGFERVHLNVNETAQVFFPLHVSALLTIARDGSKWLQPGLYPIVIGQKLMHTIELRGKSTRWSSFRS